MGKKKIAEIGVVCVLLLLLAWYVEHTDRTLEAGNRIARGAPGEGTLAVDLTLNVENLLEDYAYPLEIREQQITEKEAAEYFAQARAEIDTGFFAEDESADCVTRDVHMKEHYVNKLVSAEWSLDSYQIVDMDGVVLEDAVPEDGTLITATAELSCGKYKEDYIFGFMVYPRARTVQEELLSAIDTEISQEMDAEGRAYLTLPEEFGDYKLSWEETKEHLVLKVLFFEVAVLVLLYFVQLERAREKEKQRKEEMMLDYAEVVNKLLILLGSGMSLKQAWNSIAARYFDKREKKEISLRYVYEEMLLTSHQIADGESERAAYQKFGERTGIGAYYRLVRILIQNLQTGSRGLCQLLEQEAASALEERRTLARKLGEEAGTKMLLPMMLMLGIVIAIIMVPAMLSFNV